jgi:hypothetical protein
MMSFRQAADCTLIAQLVGRMVSARMRKTAYFAAKVKWQGQDQYWAPVGRFVSLGPPDSACFNFASPKSRIFTRPSFVTRFQVERKSSG